MRTNVYEITILGYRLRVATENDEKYVKELASYVSSCLQKIRDGNMAVGNIELLILGTLTIADELHKTKGELAEIKSKLEKLKELIDRKVGV